MGLTFRFFDTDNDPGTIEEVRAMSEDMTLYIVSHKFENVEVVSVNNPAAFAKPVSDWMAKTMQENYTFGTPAGT